MSADRGEKMPSCVANTFLEKCALIYIVEAEFEIISFYIRIMMVSTFQTYTCICSALFSDFI